MPGLLTLGSPPAQTPVVPGMSSSPSGTAWSGDAETSGAWSGLRAEVHCLPHCPFPSRPPGCFSRCRHEGPWSPLPEELVQDLGSEHMMLPTPLPTLLLSPLVPLLCPRTQTPRGDPHPSLLLAHTSTPWLLAGPAPNPSLLSLPKQSCHTQHRGHPVGTASDQRCHFLRSSQRGLRRAVMAVTPCLCSKGKTADSTGA